MKKLLLLFALFAFAQGVKAQSPEMNWLQIGQNFDQQVRSISVSPENILTATGYFSGTNGEYFSTYDSITGNWTNTMPLPGKANCQIYWRGTWYVGLEVYPFLVRWNSGLNDWETFIPIDSSVYALTTYNEKLAVGGKFSSHLLLYTLEDNSAEYFITDGNVSAIKQYGDTLVIGMDATSSNALLGLYNGTFFGLGINAGIVHSISIHSGIIDVSGWIYFPSLLPIILRYESGSWHSILYSTGGVGDLFWSESKNMLLASSLFDYIICGSDTVSTLASMVGIRNDSLILFPQLIGGGGTIIEYNGEITIEGLIAADSFSQSYYGVYRLTTDTATTGGTNSVELENLSGVTLFPNPTSDYITVSGLPVQKTELAIVNALGQTVAHYVATQKATLNVSDLPNGMYLIRTPVGESRFIKQ